MVLSGGGLMVRFGGDLEIATYVKVSRLEPRCSGWRAWLRWGEGGLLVRARCRTAMLVRGMGENERFSGPSTVVWRCGCFLFSI
jgi:hypothetical protein